MSNMVWFFFHQFSSPLPAGEGAGADVDTAVVVVSDLVTAVSDLVTCDLSVIPRDAASTRARREGTDTDIDAAICAKHCRARRQRARLAR